MSKAFAAASNKPHPRTAKAQAYRGWYKSKTWQSARAAQLAIEPLCERCRKMGRVTAATVVNHRKPHKGNWTLFTDPTNHESLCAPHHDVLVQKEEVRGYVIGCDEAGRPLDPGHPWHGERSRPAICQANCCSPYSAKDSKVCAECVSCESGTGAG